LDYNFAELGVDFASNTRYNVAEQISMIVQFPHHWLHGSDISPHVHWMQKSSATPNFLIEYRWYNIGDTPPSWTQKAWTENAISYDSGTIHQLTEFPVITPPSGITGVSSILDVKFFRDVANDTSLFSGAESSPVTELVKEFDIHYQIDSLGSRTEYLKG